MTSKLLVEICSLFICLMLLGSLACLPLYKWDFGRFFASKLWLKIYWWLPIFAVFCAILYGGFGLSLVVVLVLIAQAARELHRQHAVQLFPYVYGAVFTLVLLQLPLIFLSSVAAVPLLITICFASALSDVCAFFGGSYLGKHQLPAFINSNKSYEGVFGQIVGAILGVLLVSWLPEITFSWKLALGIGLASALGDLMNSIAKRQIGIKDWGQAIPGHGGVLDRFSSLSLAMAVGFWLALL